MPPDPVLTNPSATVPVSAPSAFSLWRQRIGGVLLVVSGLASVLVLFLPWNSFYIEPIPPAPPVPASPPKVATAWDILRPSPPDYLLQQFWIGDGLLLIVTILALLIYLALPLWLAFLGSRLLAGRPAGTRWSPFIGGVVLVLANALLWMLMLGQHFEVGTSSVHMRAGYYLHLLAAILLLIAGFVIPSAAWPQRPRAANITRARRQRLSAALLVGGGVLTVWGVCLPWIYAYPTAPSTCADCQVQVMSAWQALLFFPERAARQNPALSEAWLHGLGLLIYVALPLALAALGVWLWRQRSTLPDLHWKWLAIAGSSALLLALQCMLWLIWLRYSDTSVFVVQLRVGYYLASLAAATLVLASLTLPTWRQPTAAARDAITQPHP